MQDGNGKKSGGLKNEKECRLLYYERNHDKERIFRSISTQKDSETSLGAKQIKTICF